MRPQWAHEKIGSTEIWSHKSVCRTGTSIKLEPKSPNLLSNYRSLNQEEFGEFRMSVKEIWRCTKVPKAMEI